MNKEMEKRRDELAKRHATIYGKPSLIYEGVSIGFNAAAEIYEKEKIAPLVKKCHAVLEDTRRLPELIILLNELGFNERT